MNKGRYWTYAKLAVAVLLLGYLFVPYIVPGLLDDGIRSLADGGVSLKGATVVPDTMTFELSVATLHIKGMT